MNKIMLPIHTAGNNQVRGLTQSVPEFVVFGSPNCLTNHEKSLKVMLGNLVSNIKCPTGERRWIVILEKITQSGGQPSALGKWAQL